MCDPAGQSSMKGRGPDVMALVHKQRLDFAERCKQYQETGSLPQIGDVHVGLSNKLTLIRLAAGEPNLGVAFEAVLMLTEIWHDEPLWESCVQVEMRERTSSLSGLQKVQAPLRDASSVDVIADAAASSTVPAPTMPCQVLPPSGLNTNAVSPQEQALIQRNRDDALQKRDAKRAKTDPTFSHPDIPQGMIWM